MRKRDNMSLNLEIDGISWTFHFHAVWRKNVAMAIWVRKWCADLVWNGSTAHRTTNPLFLRRILHMTEPEQTTNFTSQSVRLSRALSVSPFLLRCWRMPRSFRPICFGFGIWTRAKSTTCATTDYGECICFNSNMWPCIVTQLMQ